MLNDYVANKKQISTKGLIHGCGTNDADYVVKPLVDGRQIVCKFYAKWKDMLSRCYSKKYQSRRPTYIGCTVCDEWLLFSNFKSWMQRQDWEGKQLDKDIIKPGNKIYSPDNCVFITSQMNSLLGDHGASRGKQPQGVTFRARDNVYQSQISYNGKAMHIGTYRTSSEASVAYVKLKYKIILEVADLQVDARIKAGLILHAKILLSESCA